MPGDELAKLAYKIEIVRRQTGVEITVRDDDPVKASAVFIELCESFDTEAAVGGYGGKKGNIVEDEVKKEARRRANKRYWMMRNSNKKE